MEYSISEKCSRLSGYFIIFSLISFVGWVWETLYMYVLDGTFYDRGFLSIPLCPIYGSVIIAEYMLIGTAREGRGILKHVTSDTARLIMYFCLSFVLPTAFELMVGAFFLNVLGMRLWDYSYMPYNTGGHIALEISLLWGILIFVFMNTIFPLIKGAVFKIPKKNRTAVAVFLAIAMCADFLCNMVMAAKNEV